MEQKFGPGKTNGRVFSESPKSVSQAALALNGAERAYLGTSWGAGWVRW
jgi:hypothetical protein